MIRKYAAEGDKNSIDRMFADNSLGICYLLLNA